MTDPFPAFEYMKYAKHMAGARFSLCQSGVPDAALEEFTSPEDRSARIEFAQLAATAEPFVTRLAARYGVPADHVYRSIGTSGAVFQLLAALLASEPGAAVAVERPAYGVFESVAKFLGRRALPFDRREEAGFAPDLDGVERTLRDGARVVCVTDLHNPSGARLAPQDLAALQGVAADHGAVLLVDEVYRDFLPGDVATAYRPGGNVVACSSLTKCYGLGGLRAGWIFASPELIGRVEEVEELTYGVPAAAPAFLAVRAIEQADRLLRRGRLFASAGRAVIDAWVAATPHVSWNPPAAGVSGLLRIDGVRDSMRFAARLREELDCQVVPGAFFGAEGTIRVSFGNPPEQVASALDVLALGIGALRD